ncbi:MAG: hypothetical protein C4B56_01705 [Candidatus Methanophagaceae archaeon]|nr:MAG: hypothetical protein C4B56_01705 [Methanophagales archaeon]
MSVEIGDLEQYVLKILQPERRETNGTGFFCHPDGYILTCYHVIEPHLNAGENDVNVIYRDKEHQARICEEYSIKDADIAVLKLVRPLTSSELKYLLLDTHKRWDVGDEIYSFGYPEGYFSKPGIPIYGSVGGPTKVEGASVIQITGLDLSNVDNGYSGAPVLNLRNKKVIGLINARYQPMQAFFVPLTELLKRWQELRVFHDVFKEIRSKLAKEAQKGLEGKLGESRFIPLRLECGTVPVRREVEVVMKRGAREWSAHGRKWKDFDLKKLTSFSRSYILSSPVGTGKTTFLYWLATQLTDTDTDTDTVPIFMPCAEFERINPRNWNELREHLTLFLKLKYGFLEEDIKDFFDIYFRDGKIFFLFDGLDQIKGDDYTGLLNTIFKIIALTRNRVIISSRPSAVIPLESERGLPFLRLKPFSSEDIKLYFGDNYEQARSISRFAPDLIRVPMLAFMTKTLIREGEAKNIFNRADIYARFLEYVIYQHEPNRPLVTDVQLIEGVKEALKRISFDALNLKEPQIQKISINLPVIEDLNREFGINIKALTKFGLVNLILEMGDIIQHSLFFTHQSFQEFLAAQYISEDSKRLEAVINEMWSPKWREVIKFLAGIRGQEIVEKIYPQDNDNEDDIIHSRLFLAAECLAEVREVRGELKEEINQKLKELIRIEPFRLTAIPALGFLGDITSLKSLLGDLDWRVRAATVEALAKLEDKVPEEAIKDIAARLRDDNRYVRAVAVEALVELEDRVPGEAIKDIAGWLRDDDWDVREAAVEALAVFKDRLPEEVIKDIAGRLQDDDREVRESAYRTLKIFYESGIPLPGRRNRSLKFRFFSRR